MDNRNRTIWIVVAVVVGVLLCCCVAVVAAGVAGLLTTVPLSRDVGFGRVEERTEQIFTVGQEPLLEIDNFAGNVVVRSGESEEMRIIITRRAVNSNALDRINVDLIEDGDGVQIRTSRSGVTSGNMSVDFDIRVPSDARLDLSTDAGNVEIDDVQGEISAHTGAGNVQVQGAIAPVTLDTGAGNVNYEGAPRGECTFETGAGNITLRLPGGTDAAVKLDTGIGTISLGGFDVRGETSTTGVDGVIGGGEDARVEARTGAGNINLIQR